MNGKVVGQVQTAPQKTAYEETDERNRPKDHPGRNERIEESEQGRYLCQGNPKEKLKAFKKQGLKDKNGKQRGEPEEGTHKRSEGRQRVKKRDEIARQSSDPSAHDKKDKKMFERPVDVGLGHIA